jgi:hypothetical protein
LEQNAALKPRRASRHPSGGQVADVIMLDSACLVRSVLVPADEDPSSAPG